MRVGKLYKHAIEKINQKVTDLYGEEIVGNEIEEQDNENRLNESRTQDGQIDLMESRRGSRASNGKKVISNGPDNILEKGLALEKHQSHQVPVINQDVSGAHLGKITS